MKSKKPKYKIVLYEVKESDNKILTYSEKVFYATNILQAIFKRWILSRGLQMYDWVKIYPIEKI